MPSLLCTPAHSVRGIRRRLALICLPPSPIPRRLAAGARAGRARAGEVSGGPTAERMLTTHSPRTRSCAAVRRTQRHASSTPAASLSTRPNAAVWRPRPRAPVAGGGRRAAAALRTSREPHAAAENDPHALAVQASRRRTSSRCTTARSTAARGWRRARRPRGRGSRGARARAPVGGAELAATDLRDQLASRR